MRDKLTEILEKASNAARSELQASFVEIPTTSCTCGKPIVFIHPSKKFACTRCGAKWELRLEVVKV